MEKSAARTKRPLQYDTRNPLESRPIVLCPRSASATPPSQNGEPRALATLLPPRAVPTSASRGPKRVGARLTPSRRKAALARG